MLVERNVRLLNPKCVIIGDNVSLRDSAELCCNQAFDFKPKLVIGSRVNIGKYTCIGCSNSIIIGNDVRIAPFCHITDRSHNYENINISVILQGDSSKGPVVVGDQTWLGFGVQIMPGVHIGRHCVIGAGSIVTHSIPDYSIAIGNPARVVKQYDVDIKKWVKV